MADRRVRKARIICFDRIDIRFRVPQSIAGLRGATAFHFGELAHRKFLFL
jgi:hypothetical protein